MAAKIKLSEIRVQLRTWIERTRKLDEIGMAHGNEKRRAEAVDYLLDLVERLGKSLEGAAWLSEKERWEAHALLEELQQ